MGTNRELLHQQAKNDLKQRSDKNYRRSVVRKKRTTEERPEDRQHKRRNYQEYEKNIKYFIRYYVHIFHDFIFLVRLGIDGL